MVFESSIRFGRLACSIAILAAIGIAHAEIANFEDLALTPESYWNGSDGSGGFRSGSAHFSNSYNTDWGSWDGFAYSNSTDTVTEGMAAQYNAVTGAGQGGSANYAIGYVGWTSPPVVTLSAPGVVDGLYVTNCGYAYYALFNGSAFSKKFGGTSGGDPDFFLLTITGEDAGGTVTGAVDFYLADYRSDDSAQDYIVDTWQYVDLSSLGVVESLEFTLSSSDVGDWGMNTPGYFAIDTIVGQVEVAEKYSPPYAEAGINGYVDPGNHYQHANPQDPNAILNPIFKGWATEVISYDPAPGLAGQWSDPTMALGPVTGSNIDIVSLGDLDSEQIRQGLAPGEITLGFAEPIRQGKGYDFVVFENGFVSNINTAAGSIAGQMFAELAYVEVSSNGIDFARFPAVSLTGEPVGRYGTIEIGNVHNLAGKHPNAGGTCIGTPFDLKDVTADPAVVSGLVDVNNIKYVRLVDIPGSGDFHDEAVMHIDPGTWPVWDLHMDNHPIYDAWDAAAGTPNPSGGFDLEAIGVLREQQYEADIDLNGVVDVIDFELFISSLDSHFGRPEWIRRCDVAEPEDLIIDISDVAVFIDQSGETEQWRN
ncbi:MAG: DUF4465 domain-containing protein [Phycisphaerales bacterium]|nr:MAG: DUF4465 domain-containing protein [Phycisphaerales bacterium]